jgi:putative DNA primase/helicase
MTQDTTTATILKVETDPDTQSIAGYLDAVLRDNEPREFRFIHGRTGKVKNLWWNPDIPHSKIVEWIRTDQAFGYNIYIAINPNCEGTAAAKLDGKGCEDADITRRVWLPVDVDPKRAVSTLATIDQRSAAESLSSEILEWYRSNFPDHAEPVYGCSGSGFQILIPCDLAADDAADIAVKDLLKTLAKTFNNDFAKVDTVVSNRSRIMRVLGTLAFYKKTDHPGRGWLVSSGTAGKPLKLSDIESVTTCSEPPKPSGKAGKPKIEPWIGTPLSYFEMKVRAVAKKLFSVPAGELHVAHRDHVFLLAGYAKTLSLLDQRNFVYETEMAAVTANPACVDAELAAKTFNDAWAAGTAAPIEKHELPVFMPLPAVDGNDKTPATYTASGRTVSRTSELSNAVRLLDKQGNNIRYVVDQESFLTWSKIRWVLDTKGRSRIREMMAKVSRIIDIEASRESQEELRVNLRKWACKSESRAVINASADLISTFPEYWVETSKLDQCHELLNCPNGTVDLRTSEIRPHSRGDLITRMTAVEYLGGAKHDLWTDTISRFIPDDDVRLYVQKLIGYSLTGYSSEKAFPIFWGAGNNGKGSIFETIAKCVLGSDYAVSMNPDGILSSDKKESQDRVNVQFMGRRLVVVEETADGDMLNSKAVKSLSSGGDTLAARLLFKEAVNFTPTHSIMLMTNAEPRIDCFDVAMKSRIKFIHFGVTVEPNGKIRRQLETDVAVHRAAMAWAVEGARLYLQDGLSDEPQAVQDATSHYFASQDLIGQFLSECFGVADPKERMHSEKKTNVYARYKTWAIEQGLRQPLSKIALGKKLLGKGFRNIGTEHSAEYEGLQLNSNPF